MRAETHADVHMCPSLLSDMKHSWNASTTRSQNMKYQLKDSGFSGLQGEVKGSDFCNFYLRRRHRHTSNLRTLRTYSE
jgi:hypothetical protein